MQVSEERKNVLTLISFSNRGSLDDGKRLPTQVFVFFMKINSIKNVLPKIFDSELFISNSIFYLSLKLLTVA